VLPVLLDILFFLIVLGIAVTIHEWGHFYIARRMGVRVLRFSIGFGKPLYKIQRGETEYCIAPIPLGGYVKMAGESYEDELKNEPWEFLSASPWRRIAIVFAGPAMNLVLAAFIFFLIYFLVGKEFTATRELGEVIPGSLGAQAGLAAGDAITSVNGQPVDRWDDVAEKIGESILEEKSVHLTYERDGQPKEAALPVKIVKVGEAELIEAPPVLDIVDLVGPAFDLGLQRGDLILSVNDEPIHYWHELYQKVSAMAGKDENGDPVPIPFSLTWRTSGGEVRSATITPLLSKAGSEYKPKIGVTAAEFGLIPAESPIVEKVKRGGVAREAGIVPGSRIVMIDGVPIRHARQLHETILRSYEWNAEGQPVGKPMEVTWLTPDGKTESKVLQPSITQTQVPTTLGLSSGRKIALAEIGVQMAKDREKFSLPVAMWMGVEETWRWCRSFIDLFKKLITREYSVRLVGGPIAIFQGSAQQARWGLEEFFRWIAILSANLAVINLFPIPILDGGHIVICLIEVIRRKRLSVRSLEWAYRLAFFLFLLPLILTIFYVDMDRLGWFDFIKRWFD